MRNLEVAAIFALLTSACIDPSEVETIKRNQAQLAQQMKRIEQKLDRLTPAKNARIKEPSVEDNGLGDAAILSQLQSKRSQINHCRGLHSSSVGVNLTVKLHIRNDGEPERISITPDDWAQSPPAKCIIAEVKQWKFPAFTGKTIPIDFPVPLMGNR